jgi:hypothetical protein
MNLLKEHELGSDRGDFTHRHVVQPKSTPRSDASFNGFRSDSTNFTPGQVIAPKPSACEKNLTNEGALWTPIVRTSIDSDAHNRRESQSQESHEAKT